VLEAEGVVEIKYRTPELKAAMHRLDPVIAKLKAEGAGDAAVRDRETFLMPVYVQMALAFAQMHDTPARMLAKGVLRGVVPWRTSRAFFAVRLRRRLAEAALKRHIASADGTVTREETVRMLRSWFATSQVPRPADGAKNRIAAMVGVELACTQPGVSEAERLWQDDTAFMAWVESSSGAARIALELKLLRQRTAARAVRELSCTAEGTDGLVKGLEEAVKANPSLVLQLRSLLNK